MLKLIKLVINIYNLEKTEKKNKDQYIKTYFYFENKENPTSFIDFGKYSSEEIKFIKSFKDDNILNIILFYENNKKELCKLFKVWFEKNNLMY